MVLSHFSYGVGHTTERSHARTPIVGGMELTFFFKLIPCINVARKKRQSGEAATLLIAKPFFLRKYDFEVRGQIMNYCQGCLHYNLELLTRTSKVHSECTYRCLLALMYRIEEVNLTITTVSTTYYRNG